MSTLNVDIYSKMASLSRAHDEPSVNSTVINDRVNTMRKLRVEVTERFRIHCHNIQQFNGKVSLIETTFLTTTLQSRQRISLLPWAGDLLKSLFG